MVEFQITKKKSNLPCQSLNASFRANNNLTKLPLESCLLNQQLMEKFKPNKSRSFSKECLSARSINKKPNENLMKMGGTMTNFRKTSMSFHKKNQMNLQDDDKFRKTTISFKNIVKKNCFFDDIVNDEDTIKQFKIIGQIGKGSFSKVSSAVDSENNIIALKTYQKINTLDWHRLENIKRQISSLLKVEHQNVVTLHKVIKDKNKLYLALQNCGKQTLAGLLRKPKGLDQATVKYYFIQVAKGLKHIHSKGICHRDLKPENILIDENNTAKIIDFGFSSSGKSYLTSYCGTPPFMCPQIVSKRPYNGLKADIWALGVMLFLMLNGKLPFKATTEQQLYRLIQCGKFTFSQDCRSQPAKKLIKKMLRVLPQERISAEQILNHKWLRI